MQSIRKLHNKYKQSHKSKKLDKLKNELSFYQNSKGYIVYHDFCISCVKQCKQSHKVLNLICPSADKYKAHTPDEYLTKMKRKKLNFKDVGEKLEVDWKIIRDVLYERIDLEEDLHRKLEELFYGELSK